MDRAYEPVFPAVGKGRSGTRSPEDDDRSWAASRQSMVALIRSYGVTNETVLSAMGRVKRHAFIPGLYRVFPGAYGDFPCPIGHGQTISQPYIVAYMTEALELKADDKVLEIGTGSGYQAAVLAACGARVYSIEIIPELADHARAVLKGQGFDAVQVLTGDGHQGWPEQAPFDAVMVTCAPESVPQALVDQLRDGGQMIIPVGGQRQHLVRLRKSGGQGVRTDELPVRFVPMIRKAN